MCNIEAKKHLVSIDHWILPANNNNVNTQDYREKHRRGKRMWRFRSRTKLVKVYSMPCQARTWNNSYTFRGEIVPRVSHRDDKAICCMVVQTYSFMIVSGVTSAPVIPKGRIMLYDQQPHNFLGVWRFSFISSGHLRRSETNLSRSSRFE